MIDESFLEDYEGTSEDVLNAKSSNIQSSIMNWIQHIESNDTARRIVESFENSVEFEDWLKRALNSGGSFAGSGTLEWPQKKEERLGLQISLYRYFSESEDRIWNFSSHFFHVGSNINDMIYEVNDQIFRQLVRDLRRQFERPKSYQNDLVSNIEVPASDRVISLNHNSRDLSQIFADIENLEEALRGHNARDQAEIDERDRLAAEVASARILMSQNQINISYVYTFVYSTLAFIVNKFTDSLISSLSQPLIEKFIAYFGL